ncbi:MAG: hypothetical protein LBL82_07280 [Oscillospiraceae bacterium]|jgi:uncharacterized FAD-dependent dehydrogenase|nr:hypothetical protein [Oscillospiraceae bacterium]
MITVSQISLSPDNDSREKLLLAAARELSIKSSDILSLTIIKRSIDARKREDIKITYKLSCKLRDESGTMSRYRGSKASIEEEKPSSLSSASPSNPSPALSFPRTPLSCRPVVCGSGPAGLFAALILAENGTRPIILERGEDVTARTEKVQSFFGGGELDTESNIQFGEGGAGTFSDGKLNTGIKNEYIHKVLEEFVRHGACAEILYDGKPHIGTDVLKGVLISIRKKIESLGGEYLFKTKLCGIEVKNGRLHSVIIERNGISRELECGSLILATGHSARDTFEMLYHSGLAMEQKAFSMGARIEHLREEVDAAQYGAFAGHKALQAADYKASVKLPSGRGVYTFCMCPGGFVVPAASERGGVVTNGMSNYARDERNSNSALLVGVNPSDFPSSHPLAGVELQRAAESAAYGYSGSYNAPCQLVSDFLADRPSTAARSVTPSYAPAVTFGEISCCLPDYVVRSMREALPELSRRLKFFSSPDALLTAPETRSSSPVRILRDGTMQSSVRGIYPCGEGAGYAGGIMSSAVDGIKCAGALLSAN